MDRVHLQIKQFRYGTDNLSYLVFDEKNAIAVDGGAVKQILSFLESTNKRLQYIINTHNHADHTVGNNDLLRKTGAECLSPLNLIQRGEIQLGNSTIRIIHTPGHTRDSLTFQFDDIIITGDTLFNGTIGNCFSGDMDAFYKSIMMLTKFPAPTKVYSGHDYVISSMAFAKMLEPKNSLIKRYLDNYRKNHVVSTIAEELQVNPYLRFNKPDIIALLQKESLLVATPYERWLSLMSID